MKFFVAGPVSVSENMKKIYYKPIGHREEEFCALFDRVTKKLSVLFKADPREHTVVIINGSGTAAIEAVLASVVGNQKIIVVSNGAFGERLEAISKLHGLDVETLKYPWNESIKIREIKDRLAKGDVSFLAMVHHETSTGALNPIHKVGKLCKEYGVSFIVDCISSLGGESLSVVDDNIDYAISNTNKCLCGLPVLSFVCIRNAALEIHRKTSVPKSFYLDLFKHYDYAKIHQTPYTPQIPLFCMLDKALDELFTEGLDNRIRRYAMNAQLLRSLLKSSGFEFYLRESQMGSIVTNVLIPENVKYEQIHSELKKRGYLVYPGKGELKGKVVNIGHVGMLDASDIRNFCSAFVEVVRYAKQSVTQNC